MKQSIEWHIESLENQKASRDKLLFAIEAMKNELTRMNKEIFIYEQQIMRAEELHKKEFDRDRFKA